MKRTKRFLLTLALLLSISTGAWAEEVTIGDPTSTSSAGDGFLPSYTVYDYSLSQQIYTADEIGMSGTITALTMWLKNESNYARNFNIYMKEVDKTVFESNTDWVSMTEDDLVATGTLNNGISSFTATTFTLTSPFVYSGEGNLVICFADVTGNWSSGAYSNTMTASGNQAIYAYRDRNTYVVTNPDTAKGLLSVKSVVRLEINVGPEVTINDDNDEATFEMPTYDVDLDYELVRDMSVQMAVKVEDANQNSRFRVQKQGEDFVPYGLTTDQVVALFSVHDDIENADLAATDYSVQIFAADDEGQPTGTAMTFSTFTFAPGKYVAKATAVDGSTYEGETALSNIFQLFQAYEVTVPAGEFATYYKDEALYVEDEDAQLYTITSVGAETATATELTVAAANTPILVKNNGSETKTIRLIPSVDEADNVTAADEFKGTLVALTVSTDDMALNDYYVCNGTAFVWVKDAGTIAANRAWLQISKGQPQAARQIVFEEESTGISTVPGGSAAEGDWYDLNGRKLDKDPKRKGIYIKNGKKVIIK